MSRIAVTGATGFVGGHLLDALVEAGWSVRALTRRPQPDRPGVEWIPGSLEQRDCLERLVAGVNAVIHAGALIKALSSARFQRVNAGGTAALADALARAGTGARLVYVSSLAACAPHLSPYAASKRAGEDALAASLPRERWTIVRAPAVYGPGDAEILKLLRAARRGVLPAPSGAQGRVSLIYGPDLARALAVCAEDATTGGATFEPDDGTPNGYSYAELAGHLGRALGRSVRAVRVPAPVLLSLGATADVWSALRRRPAILSLGKARELRHPDWVSRGPACPSAAGFAPVDLQTGFARTIAWANEQGLL